jgi:galactitol-specific phosphotransferase system IIB component
MTKGFKSEILTLRKEGKTYKQIREELGCTKSVISYHCRKAGLSNIGHYSDIPNKDEIENMQKEYDACGSSTKVAKSFNRSVSTVLKYIITSGPMTEDERKKNRVDSVIDFRRRVKQELVDYKGGECEICGYSRCIKALEFHHRDPAKKDFSISGKSWGFEKLKDEVDKCVLVCSNCHRELHAGIIDINNIK